MNSRNSLCPPRRKFFPQLEPVQRVIFAKHLLYVTCTKDKVRVDGCGSCDNDRAKRTTAESRHAQELRRNN